MLAFATEMRAAYDWGGNVRTAYVTSQVDTAESGSFDQQYMFHFSQTPALNLRYFASLRFRRLQSWSDASQSIWRTEVQPTANIVWSNPFYKVRAEYVHRENRDRLHANELTGRSASVNAQTSLKDLPRLYGRYEWTRNVNGLELLGKDTRQQLLSAGTQYTHEKLSLQYDYSDRHTVNHFSGLRQTSKRHTGRAESLLRFADGAYSIQSSYLITSQTEKETRPQTEETLLPISAVTGLYSADPTPEYGALDSYPGLIDNNFGTAASLQMNLSNEDYHNIGLDFGSPVTLDYLFLSTDTLANPDLQWAIYVSSDNLNWNLVRGFEKSFYNVTFYRYEINFSSLTTRYIKLVTAPMLQTEPVYVTELRPLISQAQETAPSHSTEHRAGLNLQAQPLSWLSARVDGTYFKTDRSQTTLAREQDGLNASLQARAARWLELTGQYQYSRTAYPGRIESQTDTEQLTFSANSRWMETLHTRMSVYRQSEMLSRQSARRQDGAKVRADIQWLPDLRGVTELAYSENRHYLSHDLYYSRSLGQSLDMRPTDRSVIMLDYRLFLFRSPNRTIPSYRETIALRGSYNWTASMTMRGNATFFSEPSQTYRSWNGVFSWAVVPTLMLSLAVTRTEPNQGGSTTLTTLQSTYRWITKTYLTFSYSMSHYQEATRADVSSVRLGFHTSF